MPRGGRHGRRCRSLRGKRLWDRRRGGRVLSGNGPAVDSAVRVNCAAARCAGTPQSSPARSALSCHPPEGRFSAGFRYGRRVSGRILAPTRAGVWVLLVLALANGAYLCLLPGLADTDYAWSIVPPVNAAFLGAGFLAGTLATGLVLFLATRWRSLSTLPPALWVLATTLLAATLIHDDRFKWDFPPTWVWLVVYAGVPFVVPVLVVLQRRAADPRRRPTRGCARCGCCPPCAAPCWWWARRRCSSRRPTSASAGRGR